MRKKWGYISILLTILILASLSGVAGAQPERWIRIQNGSQGYALYCPQDATIRRYEPEGILQIALAAQDQIMMVRVQDGLAVPPHGADEQLSPEQSSSLAQSALDTLKLPATIEDASQIRVNQLAAITADFSVASQRHRLIVILADDRAFSVDYALDVAESQATLESIVETFELTESSLDSNITVVRADPLDISILPVPHYYQNDSRWECNQLGNCIAGSTCDMAKWTCEESHPEITTIGDAGCVVTSYAMIFEYYYGSQFRTPLELDTCFTANSEYYLISGCGYCGRPWSDLNDSNCKHSGVTYLAVTAGDPSVVDADLQAGHPLMGHLAGHYVVLTGKSGTYYQVNNPVINGSTLYSFGDFIEFVRFRGTVPSTCCGCLPASCCSSADIAKASDFPNTTGWADPGTLSSATLLPGTTSSICQSASAGEPAPVAEEEAESSTLDEPDLWDEDLSSVADAPELAPIDVFPDADPVDAPALGPSPAQWEAVEPQRTPPTSASYSILKSVFGSGGGKKSSTNYVMNSTQGQSTDLSRRTSSSYVLLPGYWGASSPHSFEYRVYLPVILRED